MPTGYTAAVQDGTITDFPAFAMQCARAFGALITMRDDPFDAPVPERFEPRTSYHDERLAAASAALTELRALTPEQAEDRAYQAWKTATARHMDRERECAAQRERYEAMLAKVLAWDPPSPDHTELRTFMADQLRQSIDFDCGHSSPAPGRMMGPAWLAAEMAAAERDLAYHAKARAEEVDRAAGRTRWVAALRASLATKS